MPGNEINDNFSLADYRGRYVALFFYPLDFTFVCPSEILAFDHRLEEFREHNCEVIGVSVDSQYTHLAWKNTAVDHGGIGQSPERQEAIIGYWLDRGSSRTGTTRFKGYRMMRKTRMHLTRLTKEAAGKVYKRATKRLTGTL